MGHWYKDNKPVYTVKSKDGKDRDTTLRDARKLGLSPSVTTIINVLDKAYLNKVWYPDQILEAVLRHIEETGTEKISGLYIPEAVRAWKKSILFSASTISRNSRERGEELHGKLEHWFKGERQQNDPDDKFLKPATNKILELTEDLYVYTAEESFTHTLGFGGKVDLYSADGNGIVIDFKTKATKKFDKDLSYDEHLIQLAAYRMGLNLPQAKCYNLYISTEEPGLLQMKEWTEEEVNRGEEMFKHLLKYWQLSNNYDSGY